MKALFTLAFLTAPAVADAQQKMFSDEFDGALLNLGWNIVSPNPDGQVLLTGVGEVHMGASPLNGGSDLWDGSNYNAPRMLQPVCGQWVIEAKYHAHLTNDWQFASILYSVDSVQAEGTIDNTGYMRHGSPPGYCNGQGSYFVIDTILCREPDDSLAWVRIERHDTTITEHISFDGVNWQSRTRTELRDIRYVGPSCGRQPYDGQFSVYTNMFVEYFRFVDQDTLHIAASDTGIHCVGAPLALSVDTVSDGAFSWTDPSGTLVGDSSVLDLGALVMADSGWYHVMVSRLDCAFLSDSFLVVVDPCLGIESNTWPEFEVSIIPNPAEDLIAFSIQAGSVPKQVTIADALGRIVQSHVASTGNGAVLDVSHIPAGAYFVTLQGEKWQANGRFIKE